MKRYLYVYGEHELVKKAARFAEKAHEGQKRKYTGEDYIWHPYEVYRLVESVSNNIPALCAAWLHDTIEDCNVTYEDIRKEFGHWVAELVLDLTDVSKPSDGNRAVRKEIDRKHTAQAHVEAKTVKLADLISNTQSICQHDKEFAKVYIKEKEALMEVLTEGDARLYKKALHILTKCKKELEVS